jgi:16S rRNA processing protein RimM
VLGRPRGNRGEVTAISLSSYPERFAKLSSVHLFGAGEKHEVERVWTHDGVLIFKFRGVDSIAEAETLRGAEVRVPVAERVTLNEGEFFLDDLVGCEMRDAASGRVIGRVTAWAEYGGPVLLEIDNGRIEVPFVKAICVDIRPDEKLIRASLPEGLEDLNKPE